MKKEFELERNDKGKKTKKYILFTCESIWNCELPVILWIFFFKELKITQKLSYQNIQLIKKISHQFKMSNKHVCF